MFRPHKQVATIDHDSDQSGDAYTNDRTTIYKILPITIVGQRIEGMNCSGLLIGQQRGEAFDYRKRVIPGRCGPIYNLCPIRENKTFRRLPDSLLNYLICFV